MKIIYYSINFSETKKQKKKQIKSFESAREFPKWRIEIY